MARAQTQTRRAAKRDDWSDEGWADQDSWDDAPVEGARVFFGDEDDDEEDVNERTAALEPASGEDYDPFAEVDARVTVEKEAGDPDRERMLRIMVGVALLGIAFAGYVVKVILEPPPMQVVQHEDGEPLLVTIDGAGVIELPYNDANPPEGYETRPVNLKGDYQAFYEDDVIRVEWLNYPNRLVLLVEGREEGLAEFSVFFPVSNTHRVFHVNVEGEREPAWSAKLDRKELKQAEVADLAKRVSAALSEGDRYMEEVRSDREHYVWRSLQAYLRGQELGKLLRRRVADQGDVLSPEVEEALTQVGRKASDAQAHYERWRERLHNAYRGTFVQRSDRERRLKALRSLMRGIGDEHDPTFMRLKFLLTDMGRGFGERWTGF